MIGETYLFKDLYDGKTFMFISSGPNGDIVKQVIFDEIGINYFNLGFGDLIDNIVNDSAVSNNSDLQLIMNTVGAIVHYFFIINPTCTIEIVPVDGKRSRLYHTIFRRRIREINCIFVLEGFEDGKWSTYEEEKIYQKFKLFKNSL